MNPTPLRARREPQFEQASDAAHMLPTVCSACPRPSLSLWQRLTGRTPTEHVRRVDIQTSDSATAHALVDIGAEPEPGDTIVVQKGKKAYECVYERGAPPPSSVELVGISLAVLTKRTRAPRW